MKGKVYYLGTEHNANDNPADESQPQKPVRMFWFILFLLANDIIYDTYLFEQKDLTWMIFVVVSERPILIL